MTALRQRKRRRDDLHIGDQRQGRYDLGRGADRRQPLDAELAENIIEQTPLRIIQPAPPNVNSRCRQSAGIR